MGKAIPDRWLNYRPIGERIAGTRFIAFKVPLRENINEGIDDEQLRLAPHSLLESVPNLGLIVDLTNTNRYYNPQTFTDQNVAHQKLMIPGHQTPPKELAQRFCQYVTSFLEANPDNGFLIFKHT
ncbi:RNA/RNP complex-1-interacting phosphatase isoform X2 [Drosophila virilis]|uniref:RNA/RNP complex-1-interacting phosphatase isoform X2 n=1 Tax=Drosophila virilis TaxID=7244 RepID=UPI0038B3F545